MTFLQSLVVFAVVWFLVFFVALQVRNVSQADVGSVVRGTPAGAPAHNVVGRRARITTVIALVLTLGLYLFVNSGLVTIDDIDIFNRGAGATSDGTGG